MTSPSCPECNASVDLQDLRNKTSQACPFCGSSVAELLEIPPETEPTDVPLNTVPRQPLDAAAKLVGSRIDVVESSLDRALIFIPPGGRNAWSLGIFAIIWNVFSWGMAIFLGGATLKEKGPVIIPLVFGGVFLLAGAFLAWITVRMMFTRTFLLLTPDHLAVQKVLFGFRRVKQHALNDSSHATLTEAYSQNDVPVFRVDVIGQSSTAKVGMRLPESDKQWLAESINRFLGKDIPVSDRANMSLADRIVGSRTAVPPLAPSDLADDSVVTIGKDSMDELCFSYRAIPASKGRNMALAIPSFIGVFLAVLALETLVRRGFGGANPFFTLIALSTTCIPLACVVFTILAVIYGRVSIVVNSTDVIAEAHVGRFGKSKTVPADSIDAVLLGQMVSVPTKRRKRTTRMTGPVFACTLRTKNHRKVPVSAFQTIQTNLEVGGLILYRLNAMGIHPVNV